MQLLKPGTAAPNFSLRDQRGQVHSLTDYRGRPLVLYFYPQDDTPTCTDEACHFRDHLPEFAKIKGAVVGVSPDDEASHAAFAARHRIRFPLLADTARDASGAPVTCNAYGVWGEKSLYGRKYVGLVRTTFLIDADGKVARRWDRVRVRGHAAAVLAALRELKGMPPAVARGRPVRQGARRPRTKARARGPVTRRRSAERPSGVIADVRAKPVARRQRKP